MKNKRLLILGTSFIVLSAMIASFLLGGCAASKVATPASVNQTITTVIADAGTVAISAEQQYQAGSIPQNETTRTAINDLGNAYEQAKKVYLQLLATETAFQQAQQAQLTACMPNASPAGATSSVASCQAATSAATQAKVALDTSNSSLSTSVNTLVSKTNAVKALTSSK